MGCPDIVVVGASAGGLEAVTTLVRSLPADFPAAVFVVIHRGPGGPALLPSLLASNSRLPIRVPTRPERIRAGNLYLAPLDRHILLEDSRVRPGHGPRENGFRPAIDPLFASAAAVGGHCVVGIVLSGALDDGTAGLAAIKRRGGIAIVQHPDEARVPSMPLNALKTVEVDAVLPAAEIGPHLVRLIGNRQQAEGPRPASQASGARPASQPGAPAKKTATDTDSTSNGDAERRLTGLTCPHCGGALWEIADETLEQYECHVGHRFSGEALKALSEDRTENALWAAARALREDAALRRRMAARATGRALIAVAKRWQDDARQSDQRAAKIRQVIEAMNGERGDREQAVLSAGRPVRRASRTPRGGPARPGPMRKTRKNVA